MTGPLGLDRIVFASGNAGKAREIEAVLGESVQIILQGDLGVESIDETGTTFVENALLKARHAASVTGLPALADDSGLAVDALGGAPGVYSARYAGVDASDSENVKKLLREMQGVPVEQRGATFFCVLALVKSADDANPIIAEGAWSGRIGFDTAGTGGFGYDPVFFDRKLQRTAAELAPEIKNARSHRGKALQVLKQLLSSAR